MSLYDMSKVCSNAGRTIPDNWIFEQFSKRAGKEINNLLDGRTIRMRSFWTSDSNPSLYLFAKDGKYFFKDFSSGKGGNAFTFAHELASIGQPSWTVSDTEKLIVSEWESYIKRGGKWSLEVRIRNFIDGQECPKIHVKQTIWTSLHKSFWEEYKIGKDILDRYNVIPIETFELTYPDGKVLNFKPALAYAYLNSSKGIFQIYQPFSEPKYLTFDKNYYPGQDQLGSTDLVLGICSGLKDIMALASLNIEIDLVAGKSESQLIDPDTVISYLKKYKHVLAFGDYDKTGVRMMNLYKKIYTIKPVVLPIEKDIAENLKRNDKEYIKIKYIQLINKKMSE